MNNIRTAVRLGAAFALMMLMALALTFFGIRQLYIMGNTSDIINNNLHPQGELSTSLLFYSADMSRLARSMIISNDAAQQQKFRKSYARDRIIATQLTAKIPSLLTSEKAREIFADVKQKDAQFYPFMDEVVALAMENRKEEAATLLFGPRHQTQLDYMASLQHLIERQRARTEAFSAQAKVEQHRAVYTMLAITLLMILLGSVLAWLITRSITRPLNIALEAAQRIARGDLSEAVPLRGRDETGRLLQAIATMQDSLVQTVSAVRSNAESVATASLQIAQGNTDLSQRTEEQASALEQTAATMSQLSVTVRNNADNARQAAKLASSVRDVARQSSEATGNITETMKSIGESSSHIANITSVIDSIAFQTNILALNAAVEAARAGEQGRGFAVVAGEVRTLAQRSAKAAAEIHQLINTNAESVSAGNAQVSRAAITMSGIVSSVSELADTVEEITTASAEQAHGIEQVGVAVTEMDSVTQQNASLVEESAAASQSLREQAALLVQSVSVFTLAAGSQPRPMAPAAVARKPAPLASASDDWRSF